MRQNTNEILAENARRCAILRNALRPPRHSRMRIAVGAVNASPSAKAVAWTAAASLPLQSPPMLLSG